MQDSRIACPQKKWDVCGIGLNILQHRGTRSEEAYKHRKARSVARDFVMRNSFRDHERAENVCVVYEWMIEQHVWEQMKQVWTPEYVRGEVLVDSRGTGSLQK